jgi:hypothetical protein
LPVLVGAAPASAQGRVLHAFHGTSPANYEQVGEAVAPAGDMDGDGHADFLIGAIHRNNSGAALLYSGRAGALLRGWGGVVFDGHFGAALAALGDVDRDGVGDVLVGAPKEQATGLLNQGEARVLSGGTDQQIYAFSGVAALDYVGQAVAALGDVDRDGVPDFAVGAPGTDPGGVSEKGEVTLYSGATGRVIRRLHGLAQWHWFGAAVAGVGDLDRDGVPDVAVGAPVAGTGSSALHGYVQVFSGASGTVLHTFTGQDGDRLGYAVAPAGDLDGDGVPDVLVGAPQRDQQRSPVGNGFVVVYSGATGAELRRVAGRTSAEGFGYAVAGVGDVDGDRVPDLLVGAPWARVGLTAEAGEARVHSGATGNVLLVLAGAQAHDFFGTSVARAGDVDGDGLTDVLVGAPQALPDPLYGPGYAQVLSLTGMPAGAAVRSAACSGSGGFPLGLLCYGGEPRVGNAAFGVSVQRGVGGAACALFLAARDTPVGFTFGGCTSHLVPPLHTLATVPLGGAPGLPGAGHRWLALPIPPVAALAGAQAALQAAGADPGGPAGWLTLSATVTLTIRP